MIKTAEDQARHSTFNIQELPIKDVHKDLDGNYRITWVHRQRFVGSEREGTHEVEDTMSIVINHLAAKAISEALGSILSYHDADGKWIGIQDG